MKRTITPVPWRKDINNAFPQNRHIGEDFLLTDITGEEKYNPEPFLTDITTGIILTEGWTVISINMVEYKVEAPGIIIMLKDRIVRSVKNSKNIKGYSITMSDKFLIQFSDISFSAQLWGGIFNNPAIHIDNLSPIHLYVQTVEQYLVSDKNEYKLDAVRHLTLALFYGLMLYAHKDSVPESKTRSENILREFLVQVEQNYKSHRNVTWYADKMCMSSKYLSMVVKEASGKTPLDWIEEYCISAAKSMLSSTKMNIDEIGIELNFASAPLFSKFFKRVTGQSPRDYRKSIDF